MQIVGALLVLAGFAAAQAKIVDVRAWSYLGVNFVGAAGLAASAAYERQWGFLLLEAIWAIVAAVGIAARITTGIDASRHHRG